MSVDGKEIKVTLPKMLLEDVNVFISLAVPKIHMMTGVTLGFKNLWGCQPDIMRLKNHPKFSEVIVATTKMLKPKIVVFDGTYFLDRTGPMIGEPVKMDLLLVSNDLGAGSLACCEIMQIDPVKIRHFRVARKEGLFPGSNKEIIFNIKPDQFCVKKFSLERSLINLVQLWAFNDRLANWFFYRSPLAGPLHDLIYLIRKNPKISKMLYGEIGPCEARRGGYL